MIKVLKTGECICIYIPLGDGGLEGYGLNEKYKFELCDGSKIPSKLTPFYRIYHCASYYETTSKGLFHKYFKEIV